MKHNVDAYCWEKIGYDTTQFDTIQYEDWLYWSHKCKYLSVKQQKVVQKHIDLMEYGRKFIKLEYLYDRPDLQRV